MPPQSNSTDRRTADQIEREASLPASPAPAVEDKSLPENYREDYTARFTGVFVPGLGNVTFTGENRFDNRDYFDRVTATWSSARDMIDPNTGRRVAVRWGAGVPIPKRDDDEDVAIYRLGPNGERILVDGTEKESLAAGNVPYPSVYGAALDASNPSAISSIWAADIMGAVVADGGPDYDARFAQQKQKALGELVSRWSAENSGAVPNATEMAQLEILAEQDAMKAISFVIGGNPDNLPRSVAPQGSEAIYRQGQFLPDFYGGSAPRAITATEAQALNWISGSPSINDSERDTMLKSLFDPRVPDAEKRNIIQQVTGQISLEAQQAEPVEDGFDWSWNPLELAGEVLTNFVLKPLDVIYSDYVDPSLTWTASALPGGPRTATWEEAQSVAQGQMIATQLGIAAPIFGLGAPINAIRSVTDENYRDELAGIIRQGGFLENPDDIYNQAIRERTFEDSSVGSTVSGGIGFSTSLVWDPLIVLGPAGKALRVSHRVGMGMGAIKGARDVSRVADQLTAGRNAFSAYETARTALRAAQKAGDDAAIAQWTDEVAALRAAKNEAMGSQAPIARFVDWLLDPADGVGRTADDVARNRTFQELESHKIIAESSARGELVEALLYARTYDDASLILRAAILDEDAMRALRVVNFDAYREMQLMRMRVSIDDVMASPDKLVRLEARAAKEVDDALAEVKRLEDEAMSVDTGWQQRMQEWQNATPAQRSAMATPEGVAITPEDFAGSPDRLMRIMMDEGNARIDRLNVRLQQARDEGMPQEVIDDIWRQLDEAQDLANQGLFGPAMPREFVETARAAHERLAIALERENMVWTARTENVARTPEQIADAAETLRRLENTNVRYSAALKAAGSLASNNRFFGRGRAQGLARARERAFQRQAERKGFQKATHRTGFKWVAEHFKAPGGQNITLWSAVKGTGTLAQDALTRPFTYSIMESPAGYIRTDGVGGLENYREVQATVNNLKSISPEMRDAILQRFQRDLLENADDGMTAIRNFEQNVVRQIALRYMDDIDNVEDVNDFMKQIQQMYKFFDAERVEKIEMIRKNGFWVDEDGVINKNPFLESQLLNSTPVMDFRRMESLVRRFAKNYQRGGERKFRGKAEGRRVADAEAGVQARIGLAESRLRNQEEVLKRAETSGVEDAIDTARIGVEKTRANVERLKKELENVRSDAAQYGLSSGVPRRAWEKSLNWYDQFQSLWRFGVLFRVGYPVRNSIEGVARRIAYDASIIPVLQDTVRGSRNIASNVREGKGRTRTAKMKQRKADKALKRMQETGQMPRAVARWAEQEQGRIGAFRTNQIEFRATLQAAYDEITETRSLITDKAARAELDKELREISESITAFDRVIADLDVKLSPFERLDPVELITAYRQSLDRPRKVGDEFIHGVDGRMYWGMRGDPNMGPIMEANASARETVQATLALRLSATRATLNASILSLGGEVLPSARNYWSELTRVANQQVRSSVVGQGWLRGDSVREIAGRIMGNGSREAQFRELRNIETMEDALDAAQRAVDELDRYFPNPRLRDSLARGTVTEDMLKGMLDVDDYRPFLVPVHGAVLGPAIGAKGATTGIMDRVNGFTNKAFEIIGTMPEDQLIRLPFASRIYERTLQDSLRILQGQFGDNIPAWAVDVAINSARRRAIKDTKTFLFTQDRRTNFGRVGERFIPFVSAWQNSVVAYGKLISRNPQTLYYAEQAWRAPDRIGAVDADGNVRVPIPQFLVGKEMWVPGVGNVPITGTYDDEWVYDKSSLSVLQANIDPVMTFRAGPVFQMTASQLFQMGFASPAAPSMLRSMFGDENAQKLWDAAVVVTFGMDEQGRPNTASVMPFGLDKALPPSLQKFIQSWQAGFGNTPENSVVYASYYSNNARQMILDYWSGERDSMPTKEEVAERTNAQFIFRGVAGNLLGLSGPLGAITPARPTNDIWELSNLYYQFQDLYGVEADQRFIELFGDEVTLLVNMRGSASLGGAPATKRTLIRAENNEGLIRAIAPNLIDKGMLGYLLSDGTYRASAGDEGGQVQALFGLLPGQESDALDRFDPNVRLKQFLENIPGTSEPWRKGLTPEESIRQASISTGWDLYFKANEAIYAEMEAQGISSLNSAAAAGLKAQRDEFVQAMAADPLYVAWYEEFTQGFEDRTRSALNMLRSVTTDEKFMSNEGASATDMWQTAKYWLDERRKYMADLKANGSDDKYRAGLKDAWAERSAMISMTNPRFREFWTRYLDNDDLGVQ